MRPALLLAAVLALASLAAPATARVTAQEAIAADPIPDPKFPARLEVIHVPTGGGLKVNGLVFVAQGQGPHPVLVLFHGLPGNEKNYDLAQAVRRAGWTVVTINYRGSWGSPGDYRFAQDLEDADAALAFVRDPANAAKYGFDAKRIVIAGHSLGGWVTVQTAAHDKAILGAITISAGDVGAIAFAPPAMRPQLVGFMDDSRETLAGVTGESMVDEIQKHGPGWSFPEAAPKLADTRMLVLYSEDFVKQNSVDLAAAVKKAGGGKLDAVYVATDHSWSDKRIRLQTLVIDWLNGLLAKGAN